jgi:hypothetical protein
VTQSNSVDSTASATNANATDQDANQTQSGSGSALCGCGSVGIQVAGQKSGNEQGALAASTALQDFGRSECGCQSGGNSNGPVRVWSPGSDGSVSQSNSVDSNAGADNLNSTDQTANQSQSGGGIGVQALAQESKNGQLAGALSGAFQLHPSNSNDPTRVYSPGGGGSVSQSNTADSTATADNANSTDQDGYQSQHYGSGGCGCSSAIGIQALGQSASNWQAALARSGAYQVSPHNASGGTFVWSPTWSPKGGSSTQQGNAADSTAQGTNGNGGDQDGRQQQG